jgi:hypothetical protein
MASKQAQQRLAEANRKFPYRQACAGVVPNIETNLRRCRKESFASCCIRICDCAELRLQHALVAFAPVALAQTLGSIRKGEDPGHFHMRESVAEACETCKKELEQRRMKQTDSKTNDVAAAPPRTPRPKAASKSSSSRNSFFVLASPDTKSPLSPGPAKYQPPDQPLMPRRLSYAGA